MNATSRSESLFGLRIAQDDCGVASGRENGGIEGGWERGATREAVVRWNAAGTGQATSS
jgi:hypothetical protein